MTTLQGKDKSAVAVKENSAEAGDLVVASLTTTTKGAGPTLLPVDTITAPIGFAVNVLRGITPTIAVATAVVNPKAETGSVWR